MSTTRLLVSLKLTLLRNAMFTSRWKTAGSLAFLAASLAGSIYTAVNMAKSIREVPSETLATSGALGNIVVTTTVLFAIWVFGPLLIGGVDESLDPTRLPSYRSLRARCVGDWSLDHWSARCLSGPSSPSPA